MRATIELSLCAIFLATAAPLAAQQAAGHSHPASGIQLPVTLVGQPKASEKQFYPDGLNVMVEYRREDFAPVVSIYIFRNTNGNVPVWFDRAQAGLVVNKNLGRAVIVGDASSFIPVGQTKATGLRAIYSVTDSPSQFTSTGLALLPVGEWYVKIRISSRRHSAAELSSLLDQLLADIRWPAASAKEAAAIPIKPCQSQLAFDSNATIANESEKDRMSNALLGPLIINAATQGSAENKPAAPAPVLCRDSASTEITGVYHAEGEKTGYLMGLSDSGNAVHIQPNIVKALLGEGKGKASYSFDVLLPDKTLSFPPFDGLPSPDAVMAALEKEKPLSQLSTWGTSKGSLSIMSGGK